MTTKDSSMLWCDVLFFWDATIFCNKFARWLQKIVATVISGTISISTISSNNQTWIWGWRFWRNVRNGDCLKKGDEWHTADAKGMKMTSRVELRALKCQNHCCCCYRFFSSTFSCVFFPRQTFPRLRIRVRVRSTIRSFVAQIRYSHPWKVLPRETHSERLVRHSKIFVWDGYSWPATGSQYKGRCTSSRIMVKGRRMPSMVKGESFHVALLWIALK